MSSCSSRVLIVDDAPENLAVMHQILAEDHRLMFARGGSEALAAAAKCRPGLILLDIQMPDLDGYAVCRALKADPTTAAIPVIFVTVLADVGNEASGFAVGAVDYIVKPLSASIVRARVATHLQLAALRRELEIRNDALERTVAERTRQLTEANQRLRAMDRLKGDFLRMISHELRTPANGLLGMGEVIIQGYLPADDPDACADALNFRHSGARLNALIDDATLIADMSELTEAVATRMTCAELFEELRKCLPGIEMRIESDRGETSHLSFDHDPVLLSKALRTTFKLAKFFVLDPGRLAVRARLGAPLSLRIDLDALPLSELDAATFFDLASPVRAYSPAEALGLAPVVAHDILNAFGGDLRLVKTGERTGYLDIMLRACSA